MPEPALQVIGSMPEFEALQGRATFFTNSLLLPSVLSPGKENSTKSYWTEAHEFGIFSEHLFAPGPI